MAFKVSKWTMCLRQTGSDCGTARPVERAALARGAGWCASFSWGSALQSRHLASEGGCDVSPL
jgi:hypothetical protein